MYKLSILLAAALVATGCGGGSGRPDASSFKEKQVSAPMSDQSQISRSRQEYKTDPEKTGGLGDYEQDYVSEIKKQNEIDRKSGRKQVFGY